MDNYWNLLGLFVIVSTSMALHVPLITRDRPDAELITCPRLAACAMLMNFTRELDDGTFRPEQRATKWCTCDKTKFPHGCYPNSQNPEQFIAYDYSGERGWAYATCESSNEISLCENRQVAMETRPYEGNPLFYGKLYNKIICECPRNRIRPLPATRDDKIFESATERWSITRHYCSHGY